MDNTEVIKFIGKAEYDAYWQIIWGKSAGNNERLADIRSCGSVQHLFNTHEEAAAFQDSIGQFIADAINEKIERESNG